MRISDELLKQKVSIAKEIFAQHEAAKEQWMTENIIELVGPDEGAVFSSHIKTLRENQESAVARNAVLAFLRRHNLELILQRSPNVSGWGTLDTLIIAHNGEVARRSDWKSGL